MVDPEPFETLPVFTYHADTGPSVLQASDTRSVLGHYPPTVRNAKKEQAAREQIRKITLPAPVDLLQVQVAGSQRVEAVNTV